MPAVLRFIEPCLPSPADRPPSGSNWIHEIKHDGYRLMARRDSVGIRLITRRGNDWSARFPLVVEAMNHLQVRSCLIDGEVVCCDERGLSRFDVLRRRNNEGRPSTWLTNLLDRRAGASVFVIEAWVGKRWRPIAQSDYEASARRLFNQVSYACPVETLLRLRRGSDVLIKMPADGRGNVRE